MTGRPPGAPDAAPPGPQGDIVRFFNATFSQDGEAIVLGMPYAIHIFQRDKT